MPSTHRRLLVSFITTVVLLLTAAAQAEEQWPQWRGPHSNGVAASQESPVKFSSNENVIWKVELPGRGSSTPAVWNEQIFVTGGIDGQDALVCYDMSGEELWRRTFGPEEPGKHRNGSGSNPSPTTDGNHVVAYFKSTNLACVDTDGKLLWKTNLAEENGPIDLWWDLGTSPVIVDDKVIIAMMHGGESYLVALDIDSGQVIWKQPRQYECAEESDQAYTTPQLVTVNGQKMIVTWGADHLTGHDPAAGKLIWESDGFNPEDKGFQRMIASAAVGGNVAVVPYGRGEQLAAVPLNKSGKFGADQWTWQKDRLGADVPTPVIHEDEVILLGDKGEVTCLALDTGKELWSDKLPRSRAKYYASPILAGDNLYCTREDGVVLVSRVDNGLELLAENDMGESVIATPVPIRGGLLIRGTDHLFFIGDGETAL